jgi:hypothetical protein
MKTYYIVTLNIPKDLEAAVRQAAKDDNRSVNGWLVQLIREKLIKKPDL